MQFFCLSAVKVRQIGDLHGPSILNPGTFKTIIPRIPYYIDIDHMIGKLRMMFLKISKESMLYNASVLSASGLVLQIIGFVYRIYLSRMAGAEGLGVYRLVFPVYSVIMAATLTGLKLAVTNVSAAFKSRSDVRQIRLLIKSSIFIFSLTFFLVATPVGIFSKFISNYVIFEPRTTVALIISLFCIFFNGFEGIFESLFLGIGKTNYTAISNLIEQIAQMFIVLLLLYTCGNPANAGLTAALIMLGMTLSEFPVLIWLTSVYRYQISSKCEGAIKRSKSMSKKLFSIAAPVSVTEVATNAISSASTVLLPTRLVAAGMTNSQAISTLGVISGMAMPLITFPMVLIRSMSSALLTNISQSKAAENYQDIRRKIRKSFQATGLIALPVTGILIPIIGPFSRILYGQDLHLLYVVMLSLGVIFTYYEMISVSILNALGLQNKCMVNIIAGEGIQLVLTYILAAIPALNICGYIIGMIVSSTVVMALNIFLIRRLTNTAPSFRQCFLKPGILSIFLSLVSGLSYMYFRSVFSSELFAIVISFVVSLIVYVSTFPLMGIHPIRYYRTLIPSGHSSGRHA